MTNTSPVSRSAPTEAGMADAPLHAVLVPGFWLGGWAWADVEPALRRADIITHAVTLPGAGAGGDPSATGVTLEDRIDAVIDLVESLDGRVVLVGHSAGGTVVQCVVDRRPERIERVIYVDSGPLVAGAALRPAATADVPLPSWEQLASEQASTDGMDDDALATFRERSVPEPVGVATAEIRLTDERRFTVPASFICTSLPADLLGQLVQAGQIPSELPSLQDVRFVDLPTGHWPMFSRPADLAEAIRSEMVGADR